MSGTERRTGAFVRHPLLWGAGLGAAAVACIQILTWVGLGLTFWTYTSTFLMVLVFSILAARSLRIDLGSQPRLWQVAWMVLVMVLVCRVIYQSYMFVYINYVDPTWVETVAESWSADLRAAGKSEDEILARISDFRNQWRTSYVFSTGIVRYSAAPFILGLLAASASLVPNRLRRSYERGRTD